MTFNLTLDPLYRATKALKPRRSVLYRAGFQAGLEDDRPNKWSLAQPEYVRGYTNGLFRRYVYDALGIFGLVVAGCLMTLVLFGY